MTGFEMMLKAAGIDIEKIKAEMDTTINAFLSGVRELASQQKTLQATVEAQGKEIARLHAKIDACLIAQNIPYVETHTDETGARKSLSNGNGSNA